MRKSGPFAVVRSVVWPCSFLLLVALSGAVVPVSAAAPGGEVTSGPVSGPTVVSAEASDDVGVAGVLFLVNGLPIGPEDTTAPYSTVWDTTEVPDGVYTLEARARDLAGNESTSDPVEVQVDNGPAPDTTSPTAVISSPGHGATVSATIAVMADADDDIGVVGVQFLLDGEPLEPEATAAPWGISWDTTQVSNGQHALTARVRDAAGNLATSPAVMVNVENVDDDTTGPVVETTSPGDGVTVSDTIAVSANASDEVGVAGVQFLLDGSPLGAVLTATPYSVSWDTTSSNDGTHTIAARAWDDAGNETTSALVSVVVENDAPGGTEEQGAMADVRIGVTLERMASEEIVIRAESDAPWVRQLQLLINDQLVSTVEGSVLVHTWDTRGLVGFHQIQVIGYDESMQTVTSSSAYQIEVDPASNPGGERGKSQSSSMPEAAVILLIQDGGGGLMQIQAGSGLADVRRTDLYIDGEMVSSVRNGRAIEYSWDPGALSGPFEIVVAAHDRAGVIAVASVVCR